MANEEIQKRLEDNRRHIKKLALVVVGSNVVYILFRMLLSNADLSWPDFIGMMIINGLFYVSYEWLKDLSKGSVNDDGELVDGGADMSSRGECEYLHDLLYLTSFVQVASVISDKFWYAFLVVPVFACYKWMRREAVVAKKKKE